MTSDRHDLKKLKALLIEDQNNQFLQDMYLLVMQTFGKDGWDDPAMEIYNDLAPRRLTTDSWRSQIIYS